MTYCVCSITLCFKPLLPIEWTAESEELTPSLHQELTNLVDAGLRPHRRPGSGSDVLERRRRAGTSHL
jgi:hypothetical protein